MGASCGTRLACVLLVLSAAVLSGTWFTSRSQDFETPPNDPEMWAVQQEARKRPEDARTHITAANMYIARGRYDEAVAEAQAALKTSEGDMQALLALSMAYLGKDAKTEAVETLQQITEKASRGEAKAGTKEVMQAHLLLGHTYLRLARTSEAVQHLEAAVSLPQMDLSTHLLLGDAYLAHGDLVAAIETYNRVLRALPSSDEAYQRLARAYRLQDDDVMQFWAEAMAAYAAGHANIADEMLSLVKTRLRDSLEVHVGLALVYEAVGKREQALEEYQAAVLIDPNSLIAQRGIALYQQAAGRSGKR